MLSVFSLFLASLALAHAEVVFLDVYYESLCPDSQQFIAKQVAPAVQKLKNSLAIRYVPFGNANVSIVVGRSMNFSCQHGPNECRGNMIHACALKDRKHQTEFPICMFNATNWHQPEQAGSQCAKKLGLNWNSIQQCANASEGKLLHLLYAGLTVILEPSHKYVPWIVVNGKHTEKMQRDAEANLVKVICSFYKESPKPAACNSF